MNPVMLLLGALAHQVKFFVVFGRPGSGKSTIADAAAELLKEEGRSILRVDLDECVPQWMRDNFSHGIYPVSCRLIMFNDSDQIDAQRRLIKERR
jgi:energy-coupling factor transporter ATP-binding protein EcfA2